VDTSGYLAEKAGPISALIVRAFIGMLLAETTRKASSLRELMV